MRETRLGWVAVGERILLLPAASLITALAVRLLQPREHEPARTVWRVTEWAAAHISPPGAAALIFLALPDVVAGVGAATLLAAAILVAVVVHIVTD